MTEPIYDWPKDGRPLSLHLLDDLADVAAEHPALADLRELAVSYVSHLQMLAGGGDYVPYIADAASRLEDFVRWAAEMRAEYPTTRRDWLLGELAKEQP